MTTFHIALTGHRPNKLAGYDLDHPFYARLQRRLEAIIENALEHRGPLTLHSGMALGADTVWSMAALEMRDRYPGSIRFVAEVPFRGHPNKWPSKVDRERWGEHVAQADEVNVYAEEYSPQALWARNHGMVDAAQLLLAVHDGSTSGGTAGAVAYADQKGVRVFPIHPDQFRGSAPSQVGRSQ